MQSLVRSGAPVIYVAKSFQSDKWGTSFEITPASALSHFRSANSSLPAYPQHGEVTNCG